MTIGHVFALFIGLLIGAIGTVVLILKLGKRASERQQEGISLEEFLNQFSNMANVVKAPEDDYKGGFVEVRYCEDCNAVEQVNEENKDEPCFVCKGDHIHHLPAQWNDDIKQWMGKTNRGLTLIKCDDNDKEEK